MKWVFSYFRPSSSASSTAPTEADTLQNERTSPQSRFEDVTNIVNIFEQFSIDGIFSLQLNSRYDNHSPPSTTARNGSTENQDERNGSKSGQDQDDDIKTENDVSSFDN